MGAETGNLPVNVEALALNKTSASTPTGLREHKEEGDKRTQKPESGEECSGILSSQHNTAVALMNFEKLWLPVRDLYKIKPVQNKPVIIPAWTEEGLPSQRNYRQLMNVYGQERHLPSRLWPLIGSYAHADKTNWT